MPYKIEIHFEDRDPERVYWVASQLTKSGIGEKTLGEGWAPLEEVQKQAYHVCYDHSILESIAETRRRKKIGIGLAGEMTPDEMEAVRNGRSLDFIRSFRSRTGFDLIDSREIYDGLRAMEDLPGFREFPEILPPSRLQQLAEEFRSKEQDRCNSCPTQPSDAEGS
jgi:hypothetical protein